ncbi:MAG TPA: hypothetical protein VHZ97_06410 [Pseudonocardiaceae bacterium]|nr:hypothetical protein [Pseudonocardiaceae bacterium]
MSDVRKPARWIGLVVAAGLAGMLAACGSGASVPYRSPCPGPVTSSSTCPTPEVVDQAAVAFAGSNPDLFSRQILVQPHGGGQYEWMPLYVVVRSDGTAELIDYTGQAYTGGLDDFRANNNLLSDDDIIVAPKDITSQNSHVADDLVKVSGHTGSNWLGWLIGGIAAAVVIAVAIVIVVVRLRARRRDDPIDSADPDETA